MELFSSYISKRLLPNNIKKRKLITFKQFLKNTLKEACYKTRNTGARNYGTQNTGRTLEH